MIRLAIVLLVTACVAWIAGSPYYTAYQMKQAAHANASEKLAGYVDFPALQENARQNLDTAITHHTKGKDSVLAALGGSIGRLLSDKLVKSTVTPEGLAELLRGSKSLREKSHNSESSTEDKEPTEDQEALSKDEIKFGYKAWDRFAIDVRIPKSKITRLILTRQGLSWKLTDIQIVES